MSCKHLVIIDMCSWLVYDIVYRAGRPPALVKRDIT